jgi:hypothetical protein
MLKQLEIISSKSRRKNKKEKFSFIIELLLKKNNQTVFYKQSKSKSHELLH